MENNFVPIIFNNYYADQFGLHCDLYQKNLIPLHLKIEWLLNLSNIFSKDIMKEDNEYNNMVAEKIKQTILVKYETGLSLWRSFEIAYTLMLHKENENVIPWWMSTILTSLLFGIYDLYSEEMNTCIVRYNRKFTTLPIIKINIFGIPIFGSRYTVDLVEKYDYVENYERRMSAAQPLSIYGFEKVADKVKELKKCVMIIENNMGISIDNEMIVDLDRINREIDNTQQAQYFYTDDDNNPNDEISTTASYSYYQDHDIEMRNRAD
jgi:hypothetical protein